MPRAMGLSALDLSATPIEIKRSEPQAFLSETDRALHSPRSAPASPALDRSARPIIQLSGMSGPNSRRGSISHAHSPLASSVPELAPPLSGRLSPKQHTREPSRSFFSNLRASRSTQKLNQSDTPNESTTSTASTASTASTSTTATEKQGRNGHSLYKSVYSVRRQGSSPELPRYTTGDSSWSSGHKAQASAPVPVVATASGELQAEMASMVVAHPATKAKSKSRFGLGLTRAKTVKLDELNKTTSQLSQLKIDVSNNPNYNNYSNYSNNNNNNNNNNNEHDEPGPKAAPLKPDSRTRALGGDISFAGRAAESQISDEMTAPRKVPAVASGGVPVSHSMHLLSNISHTGKGVGDRIGKAGKGLFGKITRSGSNNEREPGAGPIEEGYTLRVINLPLVQQTRKTRIARRLESSRDKTEFWMPALPWRCIDYLNMNGCEEEGLYRIPGSGKEVKHWQRRFDTEYDINLFEEPDLHDINTIGSMFKAWLRDLPDEILPKSVQNKVAQECAGATQTPQLFKDELSKLPPFNYYLLFAITCHLSLLTSFADKNRMDYRNLCICFQPCLKMDAFCFHFLVMDWKNCWQGCWTEKEYLEAEYRYEREGSPTGESDEATAVAVAEEVSGGAGGSSGGWSASASSSSQSAARELGARSYSSSTNGDFQTRQPPKTSDGSIGRKSVLGPVKARSRSASEMQQPIAPSGGHHAASSVPLVPRTVTPEPQYGVPPPDKLPELGTISPIRM